MPAEGVPTMPTRPRRRDQPRPNHTGRRPRWDAGPAVTDRDAAALRWLGEQFCARTDVLAIVLGRLSPGTPRAAGQLGTATVRDLVDRWGQAELVTRHRLLGHQWIVPTKHALRLVGLEVPTWAPVVTQLAHIHAVGIVRLALEPDIPPGGRWVSERELRQHAGAAHLPDGAVELPEQFEPRPPGRGLLGEEVDRLAPRIAIEVELTRKTTGRLRQILRRPQHGRYLKTLYFAPPEVASYLHGQIARIRPEHLFEVRPLPQVAGASHGGAR